MWGEEGRMNNSALDVDGGNDIDDRGVDPLATSVPKGKGTEPE